MLKLVIFGTSKQLFWGPEICTVEFVESIQVTAVQAFNSLLASVINNLIHHMEPLRK